MSGPQRKPTDLGLLSGSTRAKARAKTEPGIGYAIPDPPARLSTRAAECWNEAVGLVEKLRCVTEADAMQLGILAQAIADWQDVCQLIAERGPYAMSEKGIEYPAPWTNRQATVYKTLQGCLDRFGLNPSNRSKVSELSAKLGEIVKAPEKKSRYED